MPKLLVTFSFLFAASLSAQTRWCDAVSQESLPKLSYPPIARAAQISGTIIGRLRFLPNGKIQEFEPTSGPVLLTRFLVQQVKAWNLHTTAAGTEPCQTLLVG